MLRLHNNFALFHEYMCAHTVEMALGAQLWSEKKHTQNH